MIIKLENTTTHQTYEYEVVDANNGEKLYFRFDINTADLDEGEYKLDLYDGDEHIATDLLKIGDFNTNTLQYKKGDNTYISVTLDPNVQDKKQVEIDSINATVSPDVGYTSMVQVSIDARPLYDSAYNEGYVDGEAVSYANGYDDGLKDGEDIGYNKGFESGIEEQKNQLIPISITENGTYNREDGYDEVVVNVPDINGSYDEGFADGVEEGISNAGEIIAETAQVLNITENGRYLTKYTDIEYIYPEIVTGVFDDGTLFYDWGEIKNGCYNTEIPYTEGMTIELWWKQQDSINLGVILGNGASDNTDISLKLQSNNLHLRKGPNPFMIPIDKSQWQHIKIETNGFVYLNGEKVDGIDLSTISYYYDDSPFLINAKPVNSTDYANGLFGMIKINDTIFIPKDGGFINFNTGEMLGGYNSSVGTYKYNEGEEVTGYFDDGTPFYNYATLNKVWFNTNIVPDNDVDLEVWWKDDNTLTAMYATIIGSQQEGKGADGIVKFVEYSSTQHRWEYDSKNGTFPRGYKWQRLRLNKDAFYLDGVKYADVNGSLTETVVPIVINGLGLNPDLNHTSNGSFGMVRINDKIFIPTENGYIDYDTKKPLATNYVFNEDDIPFVGEYYFTENKVIIIEGEGNLIKTVNVDVQPKIDVSKYGIKLSYSSFTKVPDFCDFSKVTDMTNMFSYCSSIQTISELDTSNVTNMGSMFSYCSSLQTIPLLNTSKVTSMANMFDNCSNLITIPQLDTSKVTNMNGMFYNCKKLINIPPLNAENLDMPNTYQGIFNYTELPLLTDFGGLIGLKTSLVSDYTFVKLPNLTYQSCINILNGLYDFTGNGKTPSSKQGKLKVHPNFLTTVGDEISIGTNKGWTITS